MPDSAILAGPRHRGLGPPYIAQAAAVACGGAPGGCLFKAEGTAVASVSCAAAASFAASAPSGAA